MKYRGVLFDYDGTLTPRYRHEVPAALIRKIVDLNESGVYMGLCTARSFASALPSLEMFFKEAKDPYLLKQKWVLICENGSKGYFFNPQKNDYEEFYVCEWPGELDRDELFEILCKEFGSKDCDILNNEISFEVFANGSDNFENESKNQSGDVEKNDISLLLRPKGRENMSHSQWEESSGRIFKRVTEILSDFDPHGLLHAGDSKMGVSILCASGDKDRGIVEFANFLSSKNGHKIEHPYREIIAIGDQANEGGNDYYFLKGEIGSTFTVGEEESDSSAAARVYDENGSPLIGPLGTLRVLESSEFLTGQ